MADIIFIKQLQINTIIGIYPHEKEKKQIINLDIEIETNFNRSIKSDDIKDTVDYDLIYKYIKSFSEEKSYNLLEGFAHYCCKMLIEQFKIDKITLTVFKPNAMQHAENTGVKIVRKKSDFFPARTNKS